MWQQYIGGEEPGGKTVDERSDDEVCACWLNSRGSRIWWNSGVLRRNWIVQQKSVRHLQGSGELIQQTNKNSESRWRRHGDEEDNNWTQTQENSSEQCLAIYIKAQNNSIQLTPNTMKIQGHYKKKKDRDSSSSQAGNAKGHHSHVVSLGLLDVSRDHTIPAATCLVTLASHSSRW